MNNIFSRKGKEVFCLLSLSALTVIGSGKAAVAETIDTTNRFQLTQTNETETSLSEVNTRVETFSTQTEETTLTAVNSTPVENTPQLSEPEFIISAPQQSDQRTATPVPGTTATTSAAIATVEFTPTHTNDVTTQQPTVTTKKSNSNVAQADINIDPGRRTRGGSSYLGIGGNIGISGDSALGDGNFAVISKIGLSNALSVRPSVLIGDDATFLLPVTYDFSFQQVADPFSEPLPIAPYIGAGAAIKTGDDTEVGFLISGGVDVPISSRFTATAAVNAGFFDDVQVGLLLGVGYNFRGL